MTFPADLRTHARWAWFPVSWLWSRRLTEPPRPCGVKETEPLRPLRGHLPFQGRLCVEAYPKGSLCGGSSPPRQSLHTPIAGKPMAHAIGFPAIHFPQAPHVRGGSVSRRGHNQVYRRTTALSGGTTYAEATNSNAIRSSGEGVWGRGASLREAASPPESPCRKSLREGARGRGLLYQRSPLPRIFICPSSVLRP